MAQFRVEFVLDQASGKYLAEMYHPDRQDELLLRTEAIYSSQEAAVLGVVQLFKNAILKFPRPSKPVRVIRKKKKAKKKAPANARKSKSKAKKRRR